MSIQVMVPLDGSEFSEQALPYAFELASHADAVFHVVKVHVPPIDHDLGDGLYLDEWQVDEELREADRHYLNNVVSDARIAALKPNTALVTGPVAGALEGYARSCKIDLIVMTTHGRGGLTRAWLGSVADVLVRSVNIPVLLLRPAGRTLNQDEAPRGFHNILLPTDGSEFSESAIEAALALGGRSATRYTLLQVLLPPLPVAFGDGIPLPLQNNTDEMRDHALKHLAGVAAALRMRGYSVEAVTVVDADISNAIRAQAEWIGADLIAMVTHGLSGWKRLALGSVSDKIVRRTSVPVLLLKPEMARRAAPASAR